ncbi:MAG: NAD+ synthase [Phycisphaerales bacterium]|nr:NAD+ synthase [Phycisphaerales bacterium]
MKIALAQFNPIVGDIRQNLARSEEFIARAKSAGADIVAFGELSLLGYPPRDLLKKDGVVADSVAAVEQLAGACDGITALVGFVRPNPDPSGRPLQNAAAVLANGRVESVHVKTLLPTYDVFDETRYFEPGQRPGCIEINGRRIGLSICEDLWDADALGRELYGQDPIAMLAQDGAELIINMSASPYEQGKAKTREELFTRQAARSGLAILYVNQVGGNDELVFDGTSCAISPNGEIIARAKGFSEDLLLIDLDEPTQRIEELGSEMSRLSAALKLGLKDYASKCGFSSVVFGSSGGIDSAVVAALAADAVGPENVYSIAMPSRYSSDHSLSDAELLAKNLGIHYQVVPIEPMHTAYEGAMENLLAGGNLDIAGENIQARIRGALVMAVSNAFGHLPLATGNKSELSTGYCTLYGDMCGGLAPIGDVLKTLVYELAEQLNAEAGSDRIPRGIITKAPSAELKPDQFDQDKLPPYSLLDEVISRYVERDQTASQIIDAGFDPDIVNRAVRMVDANEYKRQQAAPVIKVTTKAFGAGRRMPIAQRYVQGD